MDSMVAERSSNSTPTLNALLSLFFTQPELARELGVTRKTLDRWAAQNKGPAQTRLGRRIVYRKESVTAWLRACERDPPQRDRRYGSRMARRKVSR
jgi:predicted DNA-binding transcriptional regulator AlpA